MIRHKLTELEIDNLLKCIEFIRSNDKESISLGVALFYSDYENIYLPFPEKPKGYVVFQKLNKGEYDWWEIPDIIDDMLISGYIYKDEI